MKRTCNGCKAEGAFGEGSCGLDFKVEPKRRFADIFTLEWKPTEPCPKPKTNMEYINLRLRR